mgnify:CR=1 FL=1
MYARACLHLQIYTGGMRKIVSFAELIRDLHGREGGVVLRDGLSSGREVLNVARSEEKRKNVVAISSVKGAISVGGIHIKTKINFRRKLFF